jgi:hypothetical protein
MKRIKKGLKKGINNTIMITKLKDKNITEIIGA